MKPPSTHSPTVPTVQSVTATVRVGPGRSEEHRGAAHFRPPELPNPRQFHSELPFTVHLGPRLRSRP